MHKKFLRTLAVFGSLFALLLLGQNTATTAMSKDETCELLTQRRLKARPVLKQTKIKSTLTKIRVGCPQCLSSVSQYIQCRDRTEKKLRRIQEARRRAQAELPAKDENRLYAKTPIPTRRASDYPIEANEKAPLTTRRTGLVGALEGVGLEIAGLEVADVAPLAQVGQAVQAVWHLVTCP